MDILGYAEMIQSSERAGTQEKLLQTLHSALSTGRNWLEDKHPALAELKNVSSKDLYALKAFTDNIVIAWPIRDDAEIELGQAFSKLADFQLRMTLEGFFIRGSVSVRDRLAVRRAQPHPWQPPHIHFQFG
jgi:hypothetical protein